MLKREENKLKVGSKIVEQGRVYRIFKIANRKSSKGIQRIIHYKPLFNTGPDAQIICTIPEGSVQEAGIREPVETNKIKEILKSLTSWKTLEESIDTDEAKTLLNKNDLNQTAGVLKAFWKEKKESETELTSSKREVLETAIERLVQEIALVTNSTLEKAEKKILTALKR